MPSLQTLIHQELNEAQTVLGTFMADVENLAAIERASRADVEIRVPHYGYADRI